MSFLSRAMACLLLAAFAGPLHAGDAGKILIVVSGEGRYQGKTLSLIHI